MKTLFWRTFLILGIVALLAFVADARRFVLATREVQRNVSAWFAAGTAAPENIPKLAPAVEPGGLNPLLLAIKSLGMDPDAGTLPKPQEPVLVPQAGRANDKTLAARRALVDAAQSEAELEIRELSLTIERLVAQGDVDEPGSTLRTLRNRLAQRRSLVERISKLREQLHNQK